MGEGYEFFFIKVFFNNTLIFFFRAVSGLQKNWAGSTETAAHSVIWLASSPRGVHLLQLITHTDTSFLTKAVVRVGLPSWAVQFSGLRQMCLLFPCYTERFHCSPLGAARSSLPPTLATADLLLPLQFCLFKSITELESIVCKLLRLSSPSR